MCIPVLVQPTGTDASSIVSITIGVNLCAVIQPCVTARVGVDIVGSIDSRATVVMRSAGLVIRCDHRHVNGIVTTTHSVVHTDEDILTTIGVVNRTGKESLCITVRYIASGIQVSTSCASVVYAEVVPVLLRETHVDLHSIVLRHVDLVVVIPVPTVVIPAGEGLVHRLYP